MRRISLLLALLLTVPLAACASESKDVVVVEASDAACDPAKTDFAAGKITFEVKNDGSKVTELYVYGPGDRVISEVENVGPGASRRLSVNLKAGSYELACKPGQTGSGIRAPITVTGEGGTEGGAEAKADRAVEVVGLDYSFQFADPKIKTGEAIEFELINNGNTKHEFEVFGPGSDKALGEVEAVDPGKKGKAVIQFATPGTYRYECHIDDHHERGMKGELTVS